MCNYSYHHYPSCGHISNWSMTSCQEYTNNLRLAGPERSVSCTKIDLTHDLLSSTQLSICVECESERAKNLSSHGDDQTQDSSSYRTIEGLDRIGNIIQVNAVRDSTPDDRDTSSADHSDNGQIFLGAAMRDSGNGDADSTGRSDNGQICSHAVADGSEANRGLAQSDKSSAILFNFARTNPSSPEMRGVFDCVGSALVKTSPDHAAYGDGSDNGTRVENGLPDECDACTSTSDNSSCETESSGSSLCGSSLLRYNILKLRVDEYVERRQQQQQREVSTDHEQRADVYGPHVDLKDMPSADYGRPEADHHSLEQPSFDIDLVQQRIEATVLKRIEESNNEETRQKIISRLLDAALLKKDRDDRREKNAELGIEEDPHLWDTESLDRLWHVKNSTVSPANNSTPVSPRTCPSPKGHQAPTPAPNPQPQKHLYMGSMFADEETAYRRGLREIRPYGNYEGEWEGFMIANSEDDANRQGLLDPMHVRGCCPERRADFHLYYGLMHASSEEEAEKRWLEDIRRIPGEEGKFYGLLRADNLQHARAMGLSEIRHPWGCCKDALFTMPERVLHKYSGFMCAISLEEVGRMGLCDAEPVPGECGDYYGGTYYGYVEAYSALDAFQMGLMEPEHGQCCAKAEVVSISEGHTYYGYMYGRSQEQVMDRGLQDALLVPGFDIKYSGYLQAGSEGEAKAMGLFEPSRI